MKKYVKPELFYESFELNQQIAACDYDLGTSFTGKDDCTFTGVGPMGGVITIFVKETICGIEDSGVTQVESYCYHNGVTSPWGIFNS